MPGRGLAAVRSASCKLLSVVTAQAVRLFALVAAAVSAGYLWRAALDNGPGAGAGHGAARDPLRSGRRSVQLVDRPRAEAARVAHQEALKAERAQIAALSSTAPQHPRLRGAAVVFVRTGPAASPSHGSGRRDPGIGSRQVAEPKAQAEASARSWWTERRRLRRRRNRLRRPLHPAVTAACSGPPHRLPVSGGQPTRLGQGRPKPLTQRGLRDSAESPRLAPRRRRPGPARERQPPGQRGAARERHGGRGHVTSTQPPAGSARRSSSSRSSTAVRPRRSSTDPRRSASRSTRFTVARDVPASSAISSWVSGTTTSPSPDPYSSVRLARRAAGRGGRRVRSTPRRADPGADAAGR